MQVMARSSHAACQSFLTERRVPSVAVRRSTALRFTRMSSIQSMCRGVPGLRSTGEFMRSLPYAPGMAHLCDLVERIIAWVLPANLKRQFPRIARSAVSAHGQPLASDEIVEADTEQVVTGVEGGGDGERKRLPDDRLAGVIPRQGRAFGRGGRAVSLCQWLGSIRARQVQGQGIVGRGGLAGAPGKGDGRA